MLPWTRHDIKAVHLSDQQRESFGNEKLKTQNPKPAGGIEMYTLLQYCKMHKKKRAMSYLLKRKMLFPLHPN